MDIVSRRLCLNLMAIFFLVRHAVGYAAQEDRPRLVLHTGGPAGTTRAVGFSPDGSRIYAAGLDKTVHTWMLVVGDSGKVECRFIQTMRWEFARVALGVIDCMAVSPDAVREVVAVAGTSARDPHGDIVILDPTRGTVVASLPGRVANNGQDVRLSGGHMRAVVSLSFSPAGDQLVSVSRDGQILLWSGPDWKEAAKRPRELRPRQTGWDHFFIQATFVDPTTFAAVTTDSSTGHPSVILYNVVTNENQLLKQRHEGTIVAIVRGRNGRWASVDDGGNVWLWEGTKRPIARRLERRIARRVRGISFGPNNILALTHRVRSVESSVLCGGIEGN